MQGSRDIDGAPETVGVVVEWIPDLVQEPGTISPPDRSIRRSIGLRAVVLALGIAAAGLFVAAVASEPTRSARDVAAARAEASQNPERASAAVSRQTSPIAVVEDASIIGQLASAPTEWVTDMVIAFVDDAGRLRVRSLDTSEDLDVGVMATTNLPPLADHVHLLGAPGATWLLDLEEPERSGKLSNTVRMVRFGSGLDSYGFSSTRDDGTIEFFLGSLWGPAMNGLAEVEASSAVFYVPGTGIIAAGRDGTSSVLRGSGFEPMPSRLGRVVAATRSHVAGIHCDDLGRCVGRFAKWDGADERQVEADLLAMPFVRISPDGRSVLTAGVSSWHLIDVESGTSVRWDLRLVPDDSLVWSDDSSTVFLVADGSLVAIRPADQGPSVALVRSAYPIDDRLAGSDIGIFPYQG